MRYPKRRTEYLLRRLVVKRAVLAVTGRVVDSAALAGVEVRNAPSGAPYVHVDGAPLRMGVSVTDRAGWAVCVVSAAESPAVGCDLELVEARTPGFVQDFLTVAEQQVVAARPPGDERDAMANLIWSAKESALKVLRTGLRRDTRTLEVTVRAAGQNGWGALSVRGVDGTRLHGWWRRDAWFLLTVAADLACPEPVALGDPAVLVTAVPQHSWLDRPPHR